MSENLQKIIDRLKTGNYTPDDVLEISSAISAGKLVLDSGSGAVAIGGDASNARIITGNQNIIGDRNTVIYIYGAESQVIQSVVDRDSAIDNTFQQLFPPSTSSSTVDWDWGIKLLKQKQLPEIRKRLTDTLGRDRILMDVSIEEQQNWVNRSSLAADQTLQINGEDFGTLDANKMLIETFGRDDIEGKLLILGAPGAGKTTALLSLAEQLVYGAISQAKTVIPVIFELSTWQNDNQSIQSWLIEQLYDLHGGNRKAKFYEQWLERQVLLPLLDGLDELGLERQKKCTEKLNEFAEHYPQLVVCCRVKEFEAVDIKLRNLRGAVCLQSLSDSQIQDYLGSLKRPELWEAIQTTPSLHAMLEPTVEGDPGLLRVPLFVKLMADVYDPQQPISSKADLLDKYIDRQLSFDKRDIDRRKELKEYQWAYRTVKLEPDWKKTRSHLKWIAWNLRANNQVEFLIEHLQPSWLDPERLQDRYTLIFGLLFGLFFVMPIHLSIKMLILTLTNVLIFGTIFRLIGKIENGLKNGIIGGIIGGTIYGLYLSIFRIYLIESTQSNSSLILLNNWILYGISIGISIGVITGLINGIIKIEPIEAFQVSMSTVIINLNVGLIKKLLTGLIKLLFVGLISGLSAKIYVLHSNLIQVLLPDPILTIIFTMSMMIFTMSMVLILVLLPVLIAVLMDWLFRGLIEGLKQELKVRSLPNQGIWNSLRSQILTTIIMFLLARSISIAFHSPQYWEVGIAFVFGFAVGGGKACLQHLSLRIVLWQSGLPWNFARFLNYCVERRLLLRVGGSYRFLHRELLDHFAQSSR
jgi:hypothetical protein